MELGEWDLEIRAHLYKKMALLASRLDCGLDTRSGVRWYHAEGPVWMVGDAKYVVPVILDEPTDDRVEALERALRGEFQVP
jgi:hypothetical protein